MQTYSQYFNEVLRYSIRGITLTMVTIALITLLSRLNYTNLDFLIITPSLGILVSLAWSVGEFLIFYQHSQHFQRSNHDLEQINVLKPFALSIITFELVLVINACLSSPIRWPNEQIATTVAGLRVIAAAGVVAFCFFNFYRISRLSSKIQAKPKRTAIPFVHIVEFILFGVSTVLVVSFQFFAINNSANQNWSFDQTQAFIILAVPGLILAGQVLTTFVKEPVQTAA